MSASPVGAGAPSRRGFLAALSAGAAALTVGPHIVQAAPTARPRKSRSWHVVRPIPALEVDPGDQLIEAGPGDTLFRICNGEVHPEMYGDYSELPASRWPAFHAAFLAGAVTVLPHTMPGSPTAAALLAAHGPERALELIYEAQEAHYEAEERRRAAEEARRATVRARRFGSARAIGGA